MTDNITLPRATVQQALEAYESANLDVHIAAITALKVALEQQAEPVGEVIDERGEVDYISYVPPVGTELYTTPPQRKPFDILVITTAYEQGVGKGHQAHRRSAEIENPYAPGECQQAWALGYDKGKEQAASKAAHSIQEQP